MTRRKPAPPATVKRARQIAATAPPLTDARLDRIIAMLDTGHEITEVVARK
jgi:DNA-directed RNA polymerase subunit K/omega